MAFLLCYLGLQESPDGQATNPDIMTGCKKTFANVIAESLLTSSTRRPGVTGSNTTAPTGATTAATLSSNRASKQVPQSSAKFNQEQNKFNKTIKGAVLNAMQRR